MDLQSVETILQGVVTLAEKEKDLLSVLPQHSDLGDCTRSDNTGTGDTARNVFQVGEEWTMRSLGW